MEAMALLDTLSQQYTESVGKARAQLLVSSGKLPVNFMLAEGAAVDTILPILINPLEAREAVALDPGPVYMQGLTG